MPKNVFKPGNTFGKRSHGGGRPKQWPEIEKIRRMNRFDVVDKLTEMSKLTKEQIEVIEANPLTSILDLMVARVFLKAAEAGDERKVNWIIENMVGKLRENLEITKREPTVIELHDGKRIEISMDEPMEKAVINDTSE